VNIVLFGPPGAGKGTQAHIIVNKYHYFQLSTGDLLRSEIKKKTSLGNKIAKTIDQGEFANDEIVNLLLTKEIKNPKNRNKIIFDGYPRNISQANKLQQILNEDNQKLGFVIFLNISKEIIKKRIIGRIVCDKCNLILNEFFHKEEINNHKCGKNFLKKRKDDNQETIITRYDTYIEKTKPVLDFYSTQENFYEVDASLKIEEITSKIDQIIGV
jgi:adenylate kinase